MPSVREPDLLGSKSQRSVTHDSLRYINILTYFSLTSNKCTTTTNYK